MSNFGYFSNLESLFRNKQLRIFLYTMDEPMYGKILGVYQVGLDTLVAISENDGKDFIVVKLSDIEEIHHFESDEKQ